MAAASALFLDRGFAATSLSDVVERSGGSLATLYALFGDKQGLLRAVIEARCARMTAEIAAACPEGADARQGLRQLAGRLFELLGDEEATALFRIVMAESPRCTDIGCTFYRAGPGAAVETVAARLSALARQGLLRVDDAPASAAMFLQMVFGHYQLRPLCGLPIGLDEAGKQQHLDHVVSAFLAAHARQG